MTEQERDILRPLAWMCFQYLGGEELDNQSMSAGEHALATLEKHGLVQTSGGGRLGVWTETGRALLDS